MGPWCLQKQAGESAGDRWCLALGKDWPMAGWATQVAQPLPLAACPSAGRQIHSQPGLVSHCSHQLQSNSVTRCASAVLWDPGTARTWASFSLWLLSVPSEQCLEPGILWHSSWVGICLVWSDCLPLHFYVPPNCQTKQAWRDRVWTGTHGILLGGCGQCGDTKPSLHLSHGTGCEKHIIQLF